MEKHRCKLCLRSFSNGRALGGHMKAHLAGLPLPPKTPQRQQQNQQESHEEEEGLEKSYGLRENPKKSLRFADPELSSGCGSVIQDRESDTDSKTKNPTRPRSKRKRTTRTKPATSTSPCTTPTVSSSVSDTWPEEDVAISLMMLSRDAWMADNNIIHDHKSAISMSTSIIINKKKKKQKKKKKNGVIRRAKNRCDKCSKVFRSYQAMCGHYKICCYRKSEDCDGEKIFECPYCDKVFGSGQALGGHKRSHQITSTTNSNSVVEAVKQQQQQHLGFIDLNLPAPFDDQDDFSVLSDA
ncbi:Zinc finger protein ZAT9 [Morus notabilis]|uniref:Zinc finger protein ZAT9 n=2 Tax=Morus notabilis TaxID=981085 RepID=W9SGY0_9ROSA|nr:Zinc finger protein ZAT9 [Morus notabilis]